MSTEAARLSEAEAAQLLEDLALGEDYALTSEYVEMVVDAADRGDGMRLRELISALHPADVADLMGYLSAEYREEVLPYLDPEALQELDSDDATGIVEDLEDDQRRAVLAAMPEADRAGIENALLYGEDTAGRLMQREVMAAPQFWSVGDAIDHMRGHGEELPELFFDIYVVDPGYRPVGAVPVSGLLRARREVKLSEIMEPINEIAVDQDQEEVAYIFEKYHLISAPVIDKGGRLVGQITVDDIVNIIQEENQEDILALAGVTDAGRDANVLEVVRSRIPWLAVNLGTALIASTVIGVFQAEIQQLVALAVLMPVVASIGGNAGTQALTVAVRALAMREVSAANGWRILRREVAVGLANGMAIAILLAGVTWLWQRNELLSLVIGLAVVINLVAAALAGTLAPLALDRLGRDPAVSSPVFVSWVTDTIGFLAFLGLAALILL